MKTAFTLFGVLWFTALFTSGLPRLYLAGSAVQAQQPETMPEPEYLFYMPYVAKQLWETDSGWVLTVLSSNDGINYYAELVSGGWTVEGKNVQVPSIAYMIPAIGDLYRWENYVFWNPAVSWHPPFYLDFYAVRIIQRPDE